MLSLAILSSAQTFSQTDFRNPSMQSLTLLLISCLFGGMCFFSFGFAPVLFKQLPIKEVRPLLRGTFPYYYLAIIVLSAGCCLLALFVKPFAAALLLIICLSTIYARQILMGKINTATDSDNQQQFKKLHGLSVVVQLIQIVLCGWAVVAVS
ncbi:MAG: DUF4149 domain-containing protein [Pseudomonadota bacterium]